MHPCFRALLEIEIEMEIEIKIKIEIEIEIKIEIEIRTSPRTRHAPDQSDHTKKSHGKGTNTKTTHKQHNNRLCDYKTNSAQRAGLVKINFKKLLARHMWY